MFCFRNFLPVHKKKFSTQANVMSKQYLSVESEMNRNNYHRSSKKKRK